MKEFFQYTWSIMKQDFRDQFAPIRAIRNWVKKHDTKQ
jgi:hypothetical protein